MLYFIRRSIMQITWKSEILRTALLAFAVIILALIVNVLRTPFLQQAAQDAKITRAKAFDLSGLPVVDNWAHAGWRYMNNQPQPSDLRGTEPGPRPGSAPQVWVLDDILKAKQFHDEGQCIFLDARAPDVYAEGHIPGAINWPSDSFDSYLQKLGDTIPKDQCVVAYCIGGSCDESNHLAQSLLLEGWQEVYLFTGGINEWKASGFPVEAGSGPEK
jgi:rhodanese-related sulfurtransferase